MKVMETNNKIVNNYFFNSLTFTYLILSMVYFILFEFLYYHGLERSIIVLSIIPIFVMAWNIGAKLSIFSSLATNFESSFLLYSVGGITPFQLEELIHQIEFMLLGVMVGYLSQMYSQMSVQKLHLEENIANLENSRQQIKSVNQKLFNFVSIASHQLKEPIRKIHTFSQLLDASLSEKLKGDTKLYLEYNSKSSNRLISLIDNLVLYSQLETVENFKEEIDLNNVIDHVTTFILSSIIEDSNAVITIQNKLPVVYGNAELLGHVFQNLLSNSMKYVTKGKTPYIMISSQNYEGQVRIRLQDNGIGIHKDNLEKIFDMFTRFNTDIPYEGSGIGLSYCRKIMELHQGQISAKSYDNKGSIFSLTFDSYKDGSEKKLLS